MPNCINTTTDIRTCLISILSEGIKSKLINEIYELFVKFATGYLLSMVERNTIVKIMKEHGFESHEDIAIDCIAELFETKEEKYYQINNFFKDNTVEYNGKSEDISVAPQEVIVLKLRSLISCVASQRIYELSFPYYVKKRKSIYTAIDRNVEFKKHFSHDELFIYTCNELEINLSFDQIPIEKVLEQLYQLRFEYPSTPAVMKEVFIILNSQIEYSKAISFNTLVNILVIFDETRLKDWIEGLPKSTNLRSSDQFFEDFREKFESLLENERSIYKTIIIQNSTFVYTCKRNLLNFGALFYTFEIILEILSRNKINNYEIRKVLKYLYSNINMQEKYFKAVDYYALLTSMVKFYLNLI